MKNEGQAQFIAVKPPKRPIILTPAVAAAARLRGQAKGQRRAAAKRKERPS